MIYTDQPLDFALKIRMPSRCKTSELAVNGESVHGISHGEYAKIERTWKAGDNMQLRLPIRPEWGNDKDYELSLWALTHGPVVCTLDKVWWNARPLAFRVNAKLPSLAKPYGGRESPKNGLREHFTGHHLSACTLMYAPTGDAEFNFGGRIDKLSPDAIKKMTITIGAFPTDVREYLLNPNNKPI